MGELALKSFATLLQNFQAITNTSPIFLNLSQDHFSKKCFFSQILKKLKVYSFSLRNAGVTNKVCSHDPIYDII